MGMISAGTGTPVVSGCKNTRKIYTPSFLKKGSSRIGGLGYKSSLWKFVFRAFPTVLRAALDGGRAMRSSAIAPALRAGTCRATAPIAKAAMGRIDNR